MDHNPELALAKEIIGETGQNVFLTGKAGTGKTTFLRNLSGESPKRMVVLAPTGIAAINAGGMTIHSFFQLPFAPYIPGTAFGSDEARYKYQFSREKKNIIRSIDLLVIDEISMVRADLLDAVDDILRRFRRCGEPFGGVQLLLIGDIQQLPPVAKDAEWEMLSQHYSSPYFFSSHALQKAGYITIELQRVYRQSDRQFLELLNNIRENRNLQETLQLLNRRYIAGFHPQDEEGYIQLTTHNHKARYINENKLAQLPAGQYSFKAKIDGEFPEYSYPTDTVLILKEGAQVMFVKNDISGRQRYVNGSIGHVVRLTEKTIGVRLKEGNEIIDVEPAEWSNARYKLDPESNEIVEEIDGTFEQYPLKLAWAITIHKSQGLTFDKAVIDTSAAFAHGQTYVALSRCKTLDGIVLSEPIPPGALITDGTVSSFEEESRRNSPDNTACENMKREYFIHLLADLFSFDSLNRLLNAHTRLLDEHMYKLYPALLKSMKDECERFTTAILEVSRRFAQQYMRIIGTGSGYSDNPLLQERVKKAAEYFGGQLDETMQVIAGADVESDNKVIQKRLSLSQDELARELEMKRGLMQYACTYGFSVCGYLRRKSVLSIEQIKDKKRERKREKEKKLEISSDIQNQELFDALIKWRREEAARQNLSPYNILQRKGIIGISNVEPRSKKELTRIPYIGKITAEKYGDAILELIDRHARTLFDGN